MVRELLMVTAVLSLVTFNTMAAEVEGEKRVEYLLTRLESHSDFKVRIAAAEALGKIANGTVADWMLRAFRKEDSDAVRLATLYAVAKIPDPLILAPLLELANQELLRSAEVVAVERIVWNFRRAVAISPWTKAVLNSDSKEDRATAAYVLGLVGDSSVLAALVAGISDPIAHVRMRAVQAIGRIGSRKGQTFCVRMLRTDPDPSVRRTAQTCVGELELIERGSRSGANTRRVDLKNDLRELPVDSFTPALMRRYLKKNVNPRQLERAVVNLSQRDEVEEREDRTIPIVFGQDLRRTLKYNAEMITSYVVHTADIARIREVLKDNAGRINTCYLDALKRNRKLAGDVTTRFLVLQSGEVSTVEILGASIPNPDVPSCVSAKIRELKFEPIPLKFVTIKYTFVFVPPKDVKLNF